MGEKRTPYITRDPEAYYSERGEWKGWGHYLGYISDDVINMRVTDEHVID